MSKLNTTFIISGGAGRVVASIPALEKYHRLNPDDDFKVLVHGWDSLFWSHPLLQDRTFEANQKGTFDLHIKNNRAVNPEPYNVYGFYNQELSLVEAFDEEINGTEDHSDLDKPNLYLSTIEIENTKDMLEKLKQDKKKRKVVVFQPYGSGVQIINNKPHDPSNRSLFFEDYLSIVRKIDKDALILYISKPEFRHPQDNITVPIDENAPYFRLLMGAIHHCDYFVGIDSVGQYIAKAFQKPGLVIYGATNEKNFGFPDHFTIVRNPKREPRYSPWRLSGIDNDFSDRINDGIMKLDDEDISKIADQINSKIGLSTKTQIGSTSLNYD